MTSAAAQNFVMPVATGAIWDESRAGSSFDRAHHERDPVPLALTKCTQLHHSTSLWSES